MDKPILVRITTIPISFIGLLRGQLKFMGEFFQVHAVSSKDKELERVANEELATVHGVDMKREPAPISDLKSLFAMRGVLKRIQPHIVHTHTPKAGLIGMAASYFLRTPIRLHTVAGIPWMESTGTKRKVLKFVEKLTYSLATHVYSNSHEMRSFILDNKLAKPEKVSVIANGSSNGIDVSRFDRLPEVMKASAELSEKYKLEGYRVIVFVGRLVKDKGIEELLESYLKLVEHHKIKLLLVGSYEFDRDPLSDWAMDLIQNDSNILTSGFVNDVRPYMAVSEFLAFPSYREGFPNVPMQAGAMGLPSIVSNINGCNEIIEHEKNGLIIPAKSADALHDSMQLLLQNDELLRDMASNSRPMIEDRYDQKVIWNGLLAEYRKHLKNAGIPTV